MTCLRILAIFLLTAAIATNAQSTDPLAPTHGLKSADSIDREWQASVAKYDGKRAEIMREVDRQGENGPFRADWETMRKYEIPQWYKDAKFGIFIHWSAFAVPGVENEWYPRNMYQQNDPAFKEHIKKYGAQDTFGYKDLIPRFRAEKWDPADWARLFKQAGARYVIPVAEHHDGFALYASDLSDWTAAKIGPKRDVIGDLAKAVHGEGLHFGTSY